jgi:hypothetical protein
MVIFIILHFGCWPLLYQLLYIRILIRILIIYTILYIIKGAFHHCTVSALPLSNFKIKHRQCYVLFFVQFCTTKTKFCTPPPHHHKHDQNCFSYGRAGETIPQHCQYRKFKKVNFKLYSRYCRCLILKFVNGSAGETHLIFSYVQIVIEWRFLLFCIIY